MASDRDTVPLEKIEQIVDEMEATILAEDKTGASRNDVVEGTCQRLLRRFREESVTTMPSTQEVPNDGE